MAGKNVHFLSQVMLTLMAQDHSPRFLFLNFLKNFCLFLMKKNSVLFILNDTNLPNNFIPHPSLRVAALDFPLSHAPHCVQGQLMVSEMLGAPARVYPQHPH